MGRIKGRAYLDRIESQQRERRITRINSILRSWRCDTVEEAITKSRYDASLRLSLIEVGLIQEEVLL